MNDLFEDMICLSCGKQFKEHSNTKLNLCLKTIEIVLKYPTMFPYKSSKKDSEA